MTEATATAAAAYFSGEVSAEPTHTSLGPCGSSIFMRPSDVSAVIPNCTRATDESQGWDEQMRRVATSLWRGEARRGMWRGGGKGVQATGN